MIRANSEQLFLRAKKHLVGGVNSPVRAYRGMDMAPPFIDRARGPFVWDADGNQYIDYVASWGPMILGHAPSQVIEAIDRTMRKGTSFGAPTELEIELAELVKEAFPTIELARFVSSGTEAVMSALRLARAFTKRSDIIKFDGCYHGHADHLLVKAGSGCASCGIPDSQGVPDDFAKHTLVADYQDIGGVERLVKECDGSVAAIIIEPVAANMGCIVPRIEFLRQLRTLCDRHGILLIFDEVVTGFRVAFGGAQELFGVKADLTCLGKILGGGLPMGAYGGRQEIMEMIAPLGPVYQAGTLSGNPLSVAAGIATLKLLRDKRAYEILNNRAAKLTAGIDAALSDKGVAHKINRIESIFSVFFTDREVASFSDTISSDRSKFISYFRHLLENGVMIAPSPFESAFVSLAHSEVEIDKTIEVINSWKA